MLPLSLLTASQGKAIMVELKNGETINGHLINCDAWMNLTLKDVIETSEDGERFMKFSESYIKGINVRGMDQTCLLVIDIVKENMAQKQRDHRQQRNMNQRGSYNNERNIRGGRGNRRGSQTGPGSGNVYRGGQRGGYRGTSY